MLRNPKRNDCGSEEMIARLDDATALGRDGNDVSNRPAFCPSPAMVDALLLLQERWVMFIVHALLVEPLGFNELSRRATGVSAATMKQRLDLLEGKRVLTKRVLSTMPPRTEYRLTDKGMALRPVLEAVEAWAAR